MSAAAICRWYCATKLPLISASLIWMVCVRGVASVSASRNSFQTCVKMMIAVEA